MKKYFILLLVCIFGFLLVPNVYAKQELPEEGVHYFLTYPNGEVVVLENYQDTLNSNEKLLFTGNTDSEGQVYLTGWAQEGRIRVVQKVPEGYQTDVESMSIDLSNGKANFVDYRKSGNPHTGQSLLFLGILGVVAGVSIVTVKGKKKKLLIVPVALLGLFAFSICYAHAKSFVIKVVDKQGNPLSSVVIEVYAEPTSVEGAPAIKFDANGGYFLDGSTELYLRLPYDGCSEEELMQSMEEEDLYRFWAKFDGLYREGYYPDFSVMEEYTVLHDGDVIKIEWTTDSSAKVVTVDGNGGTTDIYGSIYSRYKTYLTNVSWFINQYPFVYGDKTLIGYDDNPQCSSYNSNGVGEAPESIRSFLGSHYFDGGDSRNLTPSNNSTVDTIYACWNANPDGIYVDDVKFVGSLDTCYQQSNLNGSPDNIGLYNDDGEFYYYAYDDTVYLYFYYASSGNIISKEVQDKIAEIRAHGVVDDGDGTVHSLQIIRNGQVILSLTSDDIGYGDYGSYISNADKADIFLEYFNGLDDSCFGPLLGGY